MARAANASVRRRPDRLEFALARGDRVDDLLDRFLFLAAAVGLGVASHAQTTGLDVAVDDQREPADDVALFPAEAVDVEEGHVNRGGVAAVRTGLVVMLLGIAHDLHVLARRFDAHPEKTTLNPELSYPPGILARGPWPLDRVSSRWSGTTYEPSPEKTAEADQVIEGLRERGSPAHDGVAGRLMGF